MRYNQYLLFDGKSLPFPAKYEIYMKDITADSGGETEAGTTQRDIVRMGVTTIDLEFNVTKLWLTKLTEYKQKPQITVSYLCPETISIKTQPMYIDNFKTKLISDTKDKGLWKVSFILKAY